MTDDFLMNIAIANAKHIEIINSEMGEIAVRLSVLETKMDMVLWAMTAVGTVLLGSFCVSLYRLITTKKNNVK